METHHIESTCDLRQTDRPPSPADGQQRVNYYITLVETEDRLTSRVRMMYSNGLVTMHLLWMVIFNKDINSLNER